MAKTEMEFSVTGDADKVLQKLRDLRLIGGCFKFVGDVSEDGKIWKVKAPMSAITQTRELEVRVTGEDPVEWEAKGKHLLWRGRFEVREEEEKTLIKVFLSVEGLGSMAPIINPMAGMQIEGQLRYFVKKLKENLQTEPT